MKETKKITMQTLLVYSLISVAVIQFIYALGFMTNFYRLFYDGTNEMYSYYKDLQLLNQFIFESALITLILALSLLPFDLHKNNKSLFGKIAVIGMIIYFGNNVLINLRAFPYYRNIYTAFDFSIIENYQPNPLIFTFGTIVAILCEVLIIGLAIVLIVHHIKVKKLVKGSLDHVKK